IREGLTSKDLYHQSPIKFELVDPGGTLKDQKLKIKIIDEQSFLLISPDGEEKKSEFAEIYKSTFGNWKLISLNNIDEFVGSTITILFYEPDDVIKSYEKSLEAYLESKLGAFVNLAISDRVPQRGKDILNGIIKN